MSSPRSDQEQIEQMASQLETVGDYKHGSIKRIKLKRFLTYSAVEFSPGPRLNMVVGPNGTGKSSILCAICLGLGGEPRLLGRADQVETFIQNGQEDAEIELEVAHENGDDAVITRVIRNGEKKNRSTFTWNGENISGKKVRERVSEIFQIQIDNLCTFLPQEKVGSFSGIKCKELLLETEKTLSENQDLYNTHLKLIEMQEALQNGDNNVENLKVKVEQLEVEIKKYKIGVDKMEERKKAEEQADLLRKKILWLICDTVRDDCLALKYRMDEAKEEVAQLEVELDPLERANNVAHTRLEKIKEEVKAIDEQTKNCEKIMTKEKEKYHKHDDDIEEILAEITSLDSNRMVLERTAEDLRDKIEDCQNAMNSCTSLEDLEEAFQQARQDQKDVYPKYQEKKTEFQQHQHKLSTIEDEWTTAKRRLDKLQDEKEQRRNHVLSQYKEVRAAFNWIHNNRNLFRKEVIGPIACEISPKSNNAAAYLEQHVPNSTLKSFVVQDKSDYDLLYQKVRIEKKIAINIIQIDRIAQDEPRLYSDEKMAMLKQDHGVVGYLDESFQGSDIVIEALKSSASIQKVLVGNDKTQDSLDNRGLVKILSESEKQDNSLTGYCLFASKGGKSFKYQSQISKYSGKPSLRVDDIRPARMLTKGGNTDDAKKRLTQTMQDIKLERNQIEQDIQRVQSEHDELLSESQNSQTRTKDIKAKMHNVRKAKNKLLNIQRKLRETEEKLETSDDEEKKRMISELKNRANSSFKAMNVHSESYNKMMEATVKASGARLNKELAIVVERTTSEKVTEAQHSFEKKKQEYFDLKRDYKDGKKGYKKAQAKAMTEAPLEDEEGSPTALKEKLEVDLSQFETVDHAQAALEDAEAKVNNIHSDPNIMRLYEEKRKELEESKENLDDMTDMKGKKINELNRQKDPWESSLDKIIATVDTRFSQYMGELGCVGGVHLRKGKSGDGNSNEESSFKDWGVEIKVSFREGVPPSVLSSQVQSGGERSVSTIMYLMAMQNMMCAPFRCVDEINQGLDERNERLVFKRIVENSTQPPGPNGPTDHCGQYWLITPKLLPNLTTMEEEAMNVICIFNGPFNMKNPKSWNTKHLLAMRKRRREECEVEDELEDRNKAPKLGD